MLYYVTISTAFQVTTGILTLSLKGKQKISTAYFKTVNFPIEYRHLSQILAKKKKKSKLITEPSIQLFCLGPYLLPLQLQFLHLKPYIEAFLMSLMNGTLH